MINFNIPLNATSLGQVSFCLFLEAAKKKDVSLIPIAQIDLSCFEENEDNNKLVLESLKKGMVDFERADPTLKIWHINGLRDSVGNVANAMTFHETSSLTDFETCVLKSLNKVFVSSKYSKEVFESHGVENVVYCPLGFDKTSFKKLPQRESDVISFGLRGKIEKRKHTVKIIRAWVKRFGGDKNYRLDCSIFNQFFSNEEQSEMLKQAFPNGEKPFNVNILPYYRSNALYNKVLNASDIDLTGMSGCEGFNLPLFQSLCLGKHAVVLNAHVHKDYCNDKNSVLIEPTRTIPAEDGKFFVKGSEINQGEWFDFEESDLIMGMEVALKRAKTPNLEGEDLAHKFTYNKMFQTIYHNIK